ncbi:hypothetical protein V3468_00505 [Flavobacterium oreochromis]|uniref:hypothetical protein n=1 Tax=Flavobacterium oreochromis TaxID=2906078 RepID=UPI0038581733
MEKLKTVAFRGSKSIIELKINGNQFYIDTELKSLNDYNVRFFINKEYQNNFIDESIFGTKIINNKFLFKGQIDDFIITDYTEKNLISSNDEVNLSYNIYIDHPIHEYDVLKTIPLPTNILTIVVNFNSTINLPNFRIKKHFDAYSHLGFCLVDFERMKNIIDKSYGHRNLDLINEFTNTELIDKLFEEGVIIITWGIHPFTYTILSLDNDEQILDFFGKTYNEIKGVYNINESVNELSIIPGNLLKDWENVCLQSWPKIPLFGEGNKVILEPRKLTDTNDDVIIPSFLIYKTKEEISESVLLNVDLLY